MVIAPENSVILGKGKKTILPGPLPDPVDKAFFYCINVLH